MGYDDVRQVITQALVNWQSAQTDTIDIYYANRDVDRNPSDPFLRLDINYNPTRVAGISERVHTTRTGNIVVQCFVKKDRGTASTYRLLESLSQHLSHQSYQLNGYVHTGAGSPVNSPNDNYYQINLLIPFRLMN